MVSPLISIALEILQEQIVSEESRETSARFLSFSFFLKLIFRLIIINSSDNRDWNVLRANDFKEGMLMRHQFLATRAVVEILAN